VKLDAAGTKTEREFWNGTHVSAIRYRMPSFWHIGTTNVIRLLRSRIPRGCRVLEIGFAPGKVLAKISRECNAAVAGIDYSENGVKTGQELFRRLGISADLRCEDIFSSSFPDQYFDFVFSLGLIEHFDHPEIVVERHWQLLKPGGRSLIAIPNYGGVYGKFQSRLDPKNLAIHNLNIMNIEALHRLVDKLRTSDSRAYSFGKINLSLLSFEKKLPPLMSRGLAEFGNLAGWLQPIDISWVRPLLVLEFTRD